jgi:hypothetical protein
MLGVDGIIFGGAFFRTGNKNTVYTNTDSKIQAKQHKAN